MAHQTEIVINGVTTEVTEFDHTAQEIDDGIDNLHTLTGGATTPQGALANLGAGVRPNLLDNAIFIGGGSQQGGGQLPVNQRGQTSYVTGNVIDRWKLSGNGGQSLTIASDGIILTSTADYGFYFTQNLEQSGIEACLGEKVTASVLSVGQNTAQANLNLYVDNTWKDYMNIQEGLSTKQFTIPLTANSFYINFGAGASGTCKLIAVKLEFGDTQTLAYQDDTGAWQLLPQPESDYATQLAKYQRYFRSFNAWTKFEADYIDANRVSFSIPGDMRIDPTVTGDWGVYTGFTLQNGFVLEGHRTGSNLVVVASKESHGLTTAWLGVKDNSFGYLNADL